MTNRHRRSAAVCTSGRRGCAGPIGQHHDNAGIPGDETVLRVQVEGWVEASTTVADADHIGRLVADRLGAELPQMRSFTWTTRSV
jgi:hypothetical protein